MKFKQLSKNEIKTAKQFDKQMFPHGRWLLCPPYFYDVKYEINAWMSVERTPQGNEALEQWKKLHHTLIRLGCWIHYVDPIKEQPDMVFTANAGLVKDNKVVLAKFRHSERQGEEPALKKWFTELGYEVLETTSGAFEGEGDALFAGDKLFCGFGFRSDLSVYKEIGKLLDIPDKDIICCELTNSRFYHIDTCFCPIAKDKAIYFPGAFSKESCKLMSKHIELIPICESNATKFACNSVVLGNNIVIPAGCEETHKLLQSHGFHCFPVEMSEFLKAGGAAKCLSLRI